MEKTGRILVTADLGREYGFRDIDGRDPPNYHSLSIALAHAGYRQATQWIPSWVKDGYCMEHQVRFRNAQM
ncbi:unnamed protein product [Cylicocyclus nassatus]|uniref:Uncharacterized protein n=1 Tax=Cylicocyclus nassatus TaxID=53992 RepID=A0AA36H4A2_CYLNA|nr:unnamed protein product [Cylicocyclus nassatus]